jgi:hypothetical protein
MTCQNEAGDDPTGPIGFLTGRLSLAYLLLQPGTHAPYY